MTFIISAISVAQAATVIVAIITFIQYSLSLSIVVLLIHFMPRVNTAISWSTISRTLHSSPWPLILPTDSSSGKTSSRALSVISGLSLLATILLAIGGIVLTLGLGEGPLTPGKYEPVKAQYVPDTSPLSFAATPNRDQFVYGRVCGFLNVTACPGNDNFTRGAIAPSLVEIFNSTSHGPFGMQFRLFADGGEDYNCTLGALGTAQTFIQRNDTFVVDGVIVSMSQERPGIGFWNQTLPVALGGGTWSQDILWLEPVTECVNTNLTIDYVVQGDPNSPINIFNITDRGGIVDLTGDLPTPLSADVETQPDPQLVRRAYNGAVYSNLATMLHLNTTPSTSFLGNTYQQTFEIIPGHPGSPVGQTIYVPLDYLNASWIASAKLGGLDPLCSGFTGMESNITATHVKCGIFLGPPLRADDGNRKILEQGSKWTQELHSCTSSTRASIQRLTLSINVTSNLENIRVSLREKLSVLWGVERTGMKIIDVDPLWGRIDDEHENDSGLWTIRSEQVHLPAGTGSFSDFGFVPACNPSAAHAGVWGSIYSSTPFTVMGFGDYSGQSNYAMKSKFQSLVQDSPRLGNAQIRNLIWTDIMANNIIGTQTSSELLAAPNLESISYDFRYAIPGFILLLIWIPSLFVVIFMLVTRSLTFKYMKDLLNHTSVGRAVAGYSGLRAQVPLGGQTRCPEADTSQATPLNTSENDLAASEKPPQAHKHNKNNWKNTVGRTPVRLDMDYHAGRKELPGNP